MPSKPIDILLVEDSPTDVLLLRAAFEQVKSAEFALTHVERLADAIHHLESQRPHVILLDSGLPDGSGLDALRQIRSRDRGVPIVVLTGLDDEETGLGAVQQGAQDYLVKGKTEGLVLVRAIRYAIERKRSEELQRAKQAAEEANAAKDHFLAVLSHELRTPLTPILAMAQLLETDRSLSEDVRDSLATIRRNAELEARLIDDLLDVTRISRGKLELNFAPTDAHRRLRHVVQMCENDAHAKQLHIAVSLDAREYHVQADAARLQQVFWNILKNAVKFTPVGGSIAIRSYDEQPEASERDPTPIHEPRSLSPHLVIEVQDTGIGIEPHMLPRLFNAFEQGGRDITRQFGGLGLGLTISKALVDMHGGTLSAHSDGRGKGATFRLTLPVSADVEARAPCAHPAHQAPKACRILLVEDHADSARIISSLLRSSGYEVLNADSVAAAMQVAAAETFDVLVSDLGLPDGSGLDIMRRLRQTRSVRGIAVSGFGMESDIQKSLEAGFHEHLTKPFNVDQLLTAIARVARL